MKPNLFTALLRLMRASCFPVDLSSRGLTYMNHKGKLADVYAYYRLPQGKFVIPAKLRTHYYNVMGDNMSDEEYLELKYAPLPPIGTEPPKPTYEELCKRVDEEVENCLPSNGLFKRLDKRHDYAKGITFKVDKDLLELPKDDQDYFKIFVQADVPGAFERLAASSISARIENHGIHCEYGQPIRKTYESQKSFIDRCGFVDAGNVCLEIKRIVKVDGKLCFDARLIGPFASVLRSFLDSDFDVYFGTRHWSMSGHDVFGIDVLRVPREGIRFY
jgi:hypothetical protein